MRATCACTLLILVACTALANAAPAEPLPTSEEIHQLFSDGKNQEVLRKLSRVMTAKEWKGKQFDHYDLLMVKADTHLRMKEATPAASAYAQAAKEGTDRKSIAVARAMELLIKKSVGLHYTPKPAPGADKKTADKSGPPPIDIVDPEQRKLAMKALYEDEKTASDGRFKAAREGKSIPAIMDLFPTIAQLRILDFAVNESDAETKQAATPLAEHSKDILGQAVEKLGIRIDEISTAANSMTEYRVQGQNLWMKKGLQASQPAELTDARQTCAKVIESARALTEGLETEPDYYAALVKNTQRVQEKAGTTQEANYGGTYKNKWGK